MNKKFSFFLSFLISCTVAVSLIDASEKPETMTLDVSFADSLWDGKKIPEGQQCLRFGGNNPGTPRLAVKNIPESADAIIMEYSDRSYFPMDRGGHGKIGYSIPKGTLTIEIPSVPGHTFNLPDGFFITAPHLAPGWDKPGAYMPPCSGGRGNSYYVTIKAVAMDSSRTNKYTVLGQSVLELGTY